MNSFILTCVSDLAAFPIEMCGLVHSYLCFCSWGFPNIISYMLWMTSFLNLVWYFNCRFIRVDLVLCNGN